MFPSVGAATRLFNTVYCVIANPFVLGCSIFDPGQIDLIGVFQFSPEPGGIYISEKKASTFDILMVESLLGVDPTQRYLENKKALIAKDFIDFAIKPH